MDPRVRAPGRGCSSEPGDPVGAGPGVHQVVDVASLRAVEEAVGVVRVAGLRPVVAVVTTPLVPVASLHTASEARHGHQVVDCPASAPPDSLIGCRGGEGGNTDQ